MTVNNALGPEVKHGGNALQSYLTSLVYLRQEAKRDGLEPIAEIMCGAVAAIEQWLASGEVPAHSREVLNSSLCHSLDFLFHWRSLPPARQRQVAYDIARYESGTDDREVAAPARRRASKRIAS
jgi:hypothetical protein